MLLLSSPCIVTLDVGTSSVRTLLFDAGGQELAGFGEHQTYQIATTHDGGVEVDSDALLKFCVDCLTKIHAQLAAAKVKPVAVAFDTFWHGLLGIDESQKPTTRVIHAFDNRSAKEATKLATLLEPRRSHARTGCRLHTSYWPSKLVWLSKERETVFRATKRWISFGEYLYLRLFGDPIVSTSMASANGLWNQQANDYDEEMLDVLPISRAELCPADSMDRPATKLLDPYRTEWPLFDGIPWFPAWGDGACNNIGSGCTTVNEFSLMVGTSGAMRAVLESNSVDIPNGLWCYRVDRKRFILGGSLSNGGDVYAWLRRTLQLPSEAEEENDLANRKPGAHGLLLLPFFAGERSPYWRADLRAAVTGMDLGTSPMDILQAALEAVSLGFRDIFLFMAESLGTPRQVIGSGGALLASRAWTKMMADALGMTVTPCLEREATSRGAALLAFERLGIIANVGDVAMQSGPPLDSDPANNQVYQELHVSQQQLFRKLFVES